MSTSKRFVAKNGLDNNSNTIQNVSDPVNAQDAATRAYVLANVGYSNLYAFENNITIDVNYTITTNKNAMSAGPVTIANGISVTVPSGSVWTIV